MIRKEKRIRLWIGWTWLNFKLIPLPILKLWFVSLVELIALTRKISFHISAFKKLILWWNSRKFKPKLTLYGMCFELTLYNDADFLALGPMMRSYLKVRSIFRSRELVRSEFWPHTRQWQVMFLDWLYLRIYRIQHMDGMDMLLVCHFIITIGHKSPWNGNNWCWHPIWC